MEAVSNESGLDGVEGILSINDKSSIDERFTKLGEHIFSLKLENACLRREVTNVSAQIQLNAIREQVLFYTQMFPIMFGYLKQDYEGQLLDFINRVEEAPGDTIGEKVDYVANELPDILQEYYEIYLEAQPSHLTPGSQQGRRETMEAVLSERDLDRVGDTLLINNGSSVDERFAKLAEEVYSLKLENASLRNDIMDISLYVNLNAIREQVLVYTHKFPTVYDNLRKEYDEQISVITDRVKEAPGDSLNEKVSYVVSELYAEGKLLHIFSLVVKAILYGIPGDMFGVISAFNTWYSNYKRNPKSDGGIGDGLPRLSDLPNILLMAYVLYLETQHKQNM